MIQKYSTLAKKPIPAPNTGNITGAGFISPKGEPFNCEGFTHGTWILENIDWLREQGYNIENPGAVMRGSELDSLRDDLVRQGWIHVFNYDIMSVWKLDFKTEKMIRDAFLNQDIYPDSPVDEVKVYEQSSGNSYHVDLKEEI